MPKFYCDYCDTYLTHDSPSVRKTHCSGRKHKENVKDYYQKWMEEQAQSLIDKTTAAFQQGKIPPTPFSAPPPAGAMIPPPPSIPGPPRPGMMPAPHMGGPPMMPMMGPPPPGMMPGWTCSWDEATHGRTHANDARASHDETPLQTHDGANQARNDPSRQIKMEMKLPFHIRTFPMTNTTDLCPRGFVLSVWRDSAVTSAYECTHPALTCTRSGFLGVSLTVLFPPLPVQ
ncbi:U1 small nuclear ribonucleoprotein C isoform X2 [Molothrus ater]|uniref:U1 small nuclear ribonucleoprotein C isoform X2 n=1 Tax=Molothrus ater TaxID=84834 RepID=UPI00174E7B05|nr:U1 small nuclear ribonucleoprotein C isoform X2 [Molothrus ater]